MTTEHENIIVDAELRTLEVPHKGITLRSLQALAAKHSKPHSRPWWAVTYQGCVIARVRLHTIKALKDELASQE